MILDRLKPLATLRFWCLFFLAGVFFLIFGLLSFNLFFLLRANIDLFIENGVMVIADGALQQLVELIGYGYLSLLFFVLFKACEHELIACLTKEPQGAKPCSPPM